MDKSMNALFIIVILSLIVLFSSIFHRFYSLTPPSGSLVSEGQFNIADFPPVINADDFIGNASDLVTILATAYDPNGLSVTLTYGPPLNQSGQWQSTLNDSGITYANITAYDNTSQSVLTVAIKLSPYCGDGVLDPGEECDDGNEVSGDGCSRYCVIEAAPPSGGGGGAPSRPPEIELPPVPEAPSPEISAPVPRPAPSPVEPVPAPEIPAAEPGAPQLKEVLPSYQISAGEESEILVQDPEGNPVPDVGVRLTSPTGKQHLLKTGPDGKLSFDFKEPGQWSALIYKAGYRSRSFGINIAAAEEPVPPFVEAPGVLPPLPCWSSGLFLAILLVTIFTSVFYYVYHRKRD